MRRRPLLLAAAFAALTAFAAAAPLTVKEVDFLVRMGTPEAEIVGNLTERRLLVPLDAAGEKQLVVSGASAGLIARLKSGAYTLPVEQARAEIQRRSAQQQLTAVQVTDDRAQAETRRNAEIAARAQGRGTVQAWLKDQLVYQEGGNLKPLDNGIVSNTRVFAFYAAASSSGPCKQFTPKLVAAYRALKEKHPDLEVIFVSSDRDEYNMTQQMRAFAMPWPALKHKEVPKEIAGFMGESIPWLVLLGDDGRPLSRNGVDKKYLDPDQMLASLDSFLDQRKAAGL